MFRLVSALVLATALLTPVSSLAAVAPNPTRDISLTRWQGSQLSAGTNRGTVVSDAGVAFGTRTGTREYGGRSYERARWTAPWQMSAFSFTELIASWEAITPGDSWIDVEVRGRNSKGVTASWDVLGRWTSGDKFVRRTTDSPQSDDLASVSVDTWRTGSVGLVSWQLRLSLYRKAGTTGPTVASLGAMASRLPASSSVKVSTPGPSVGTVLDVPAYSQMVHAGHYPQWGGGGEAWCSPTSTSMVLGYYDALPPRSAYRFVPAGHPAPWVDYAARRTYDSDYEGTGNWPFNTAYAAPLAGDAFVTRLRSLREAEGFIAAGIPLVASISWARGTLIGSHVSASNGHLVVIVGFTADGDVVTNDPAADTAAGVRTTYDRAQFENAWLPTSGGLVYVIHDAAHPLPAAPAQANW
ncbi:MAG: C39 family peptidase [Nocardioides sp.]